MSHSLQTIFIIYLFAIFQERFGERLGSHHSHVGPLARHAGAATGDFDARHDSSASRTLQRNLSSDSFHVDREVSAMFHQNTIIARL